jgi:ferredoxin
VPERAISQGDEIYVIDPNKCTECVGHFDERRSASEVCPVDCIPFNPDHPRQGELMEKFLKLTADKRPAVSARVSVRKEDTAH